VLDILEKHHTKAEIEQAINVVRAAGIAPRPTWVAFTPWTTLADYLDMLEFVEANQLIDNVDPVQYTIRLLIPPNSYILNRPELKPHLGPLNQAAFSYTWTHPDPRMDRLHEQVLALVDGASGAQEDRFATFANVWELTERAHDVAVRDPFALVPQGALSREPIPHLSEPWYC